MDFPLNQFWDMDERTDIHKPIMTNNGWGEGYASFWITRLSSGIKSIME
jgi:hypothetical protein